MIKIFFKVQVFESSGKYYTEEIVGLELLLEQLLISNSLCIYMPKVVELIKEKFKDRFKDMYLLVDHAEGYPCLITPESRDETSKMS